MALNRDTVRQNGTQQRHRTYALWDVSDPHAPPLYHARGHNGWIQMVVFSPDGIYLVTGGNDHVVNVWVCFSQLRHGKDQKYHFKY